jgi:MOSC domain-containing protein YiiM
MTIDMLTLSADSGLEYPQELQLKQDFGIVGDKFAGRGDRHVCMLDTEVAKNVKTLNGLCTKKFLGNFLTSGMCYQSLEVGQRFLVGTAEIEIIQKGKKCYPECVLVMAGTPCELPKGSAFAKVIKSGTAKLNDEIIPID